MVRLRIPNHPTKQELETLYWKDELNTPEIGEAFGVSKTAVLNWMREYDVPRRSQGESLRLTMEKRWQDPEYRAVMMVHLREYWSRSEERSQNSKQLWQNPEFKVKMSEIQKDLWQNPMHRAKIHEGRKGIWQNLEYRSKMIEERQRRWQDPKFKEKMYVANKKAWENPERKDHMRERIKALWQTSEYREKVVSNVIHSIHERPTNPEKELIGIIEQYNLPFKYVGDGSLIIGSLNPDFIHSNGKKKVIEVFGRVFHDPEESFFEVSWKRQYWGRMSYYSQLGYDCLILWDDELKNTERVVGRIEEFLK